MKKGTVNLATHSLPLETMAKVVSQCAASFTQARGLRPDLQRQAGVAAENIYRTGEKPSLSIELGVKQAIALNQLASQTVH